MKKLPVYAVIALVIATGGYRFWASNPATSSGKPLISVSVPDLSGAAKEGEIAFNNNCSSCHGANAAGQDGIAPPLIHKIYEPNHHGDQAFILAAKNGVRAHHWPFGNMPPIPGASRSDLRKIISYVRTLQRANGIN